MEEIGDNCTALLEVCHEVGGDNDLLLEVFQGDEFDLGREVSLFVLLRKVVWGNNALRTHLESFETLLVELQLALFGCRFGPPSWAPMSSEFVEALLVDIVVEAKNLLDPRFSRGRDE